MLFFGRLLALSALSTGCVGGANRDDAVQLEWRAGDTWHLATSHRIANSGTAGRPMDFENPTVARLDAEHWSEDVVWSYQVVEQGLIPTIDDTLYDFAVTVDGGVASLAVIRAFVDPTLNDDEGLLETDPVVYLVFREDRDRMAGLVTFSNVGGKRTERAYTSGQLDRSWSSLSQSNLAMAPTYLAPFGFTSRSEERMTETGSWIATEPVDGEGVDVVFSDEFGGGTVALRYQEGAPWPTWTSSANLESRMLDDADIDRLRTSRPWLAAEPPADYDYRKALASGIDIDAAMVISEEDVAAGGWSAGVPSGYVPWAGAWWPQTEGALVFGEGGSTFSLLIKDDVDPLKEELSYLRDRATRLLDGPEKDELVNEFQARATEMRDLIVSFYTDMQLDLDGGIIVVSDGVISHTRDGWSYNIDDLSPMDKFALHMYLEGASPTVNPFLLPAEELLHDYKPNGDDWWGHCTGWAAASILTEEPRESVIVTAGAHELTYSTGDLKGLLTEAHTATYAHIFGSRYNKEGEDLADLHPQAFHKLISFYHRQQQVGIVFDTTADTPVWNYPAYDSQVAIDETTKSHPSLNINTAAAYKLAQLTGIDAYDAGKIVSYRIDHGPFQAVEDLASVEGISLRMVKDLGTVITVDPFQRNFYVRARLTFTNNAVPASHASADPDQPESFTEVYRYVLTTDQNGTITGGEWEDNSRHPDFAWVPYDNPSHAGSAENRFMQYDLVKELVADFDRQ
jgi:competence ComEA-like helix-hairpin-helix protein